MLRFLTAGESHGRRLMVIVEGLPACVPVAAARIDADLGRRQQCYGRGGRMKIEKDQARIVSVVRHGETPDLAGETSDLDARRVLLEDLEAARFSRGEARALGVDARAARPYRRCILCVCMVAGIRYNHCIRISIRARI